MLLFISLLCLFLLFLFPGICLQGAKNGLLLWFNVVLPTLFPFMTLSLFMTKTSLCHKLSRLCPAPVRKILGVSSAGVYPVIMGLLSGFPVGAKIVNTLYQEKQISRKEANYLLCLAGNISPMFLTTYIGEHCLHLGSKRYLLLPVLYISAFASANILKHFIFSRYNEDGPDMQEKTLAAPASPDYQTQKPVENSPHRLTAITALNQAVSDSLCTLAVVGGYIMLFSLLGNVILCLMPATPAAILTTVSEITTGSSYIRTITSFSPLQKIILLSSLSSFGGLSSVAQTGSVVTEPGLSLPCYVLGKVLQAVINAALCLLVFLV